MPSSMRWIILFVVTVFGSGCVSMSAFQSAKTMKQGEWAGFVGAGYQSVVFTEESDDETTADAEDALEEIKVPIIEAGARYGVFKGFDAGLRYTIPGTISGDVKYKLLGDGAFAMSIGAGLGYGSFEVGASSSSDDDSDDTGDTTTSGDDDDDDSTEFTIIDAFVPLYVSYDISDWFTVTLTPRYLMRMNSSTAEDSEDTTSSIIGASLGVNLAWFVVEAGYYTSPGNEDSGIQQIMVGYWGGWDNVE